MEFLIIKLQDVRKLTPIITAGGDPLEIVAQPPRLRADRVPAPAPEIVEYSLPMKDRPGVLYTTEAAACEAAQKLAEKNPGDVWVVFRPMVAFEGKKPEKIDILVKEFNSAGELVIMKE